MTDRRKTEKMRVSERERRGGGGGVRGPLGQLEKNEERGRGAEKQRMGRRERWGHREKEREGGGGETDRQTDKKTDG